MVDDEKVKEETTDLLGKIDTLKTQIKTFEKELGINSEDFRMQWTESDSKVLERMRESEDQLNVIENIVKNKAPEITPPDQWKPTSIVEQPPELTGPTKVPAQEELQDKTAELKKKSDQIAEITSLVSRLRTEMLSEKPKIIQNQIAPQKPPQAQPAAQKMQPAQQQNVAKEAPKPVQPVRYSAGDLPSLNLLVQKLSDLVKENSAIADELREMIDETKNVNKASRISELIRKLAVAGLNG